MYTYIIASFLGWLQSLLSNSAITNALAHQIANAPGGGLAVFLIICLLIWRGYTIGPLGSLRKQRRKGKQGDTPNDQAANP